MYLCNNRKHVRMFRMDSKLLCYKRPLCIGWLLRCVCVTWPACICDVMCLGTWVCVCVCVCVCVHTCISSRLFWYAFFFLIHILIFCVTNIRCASVDYSDVCVWLDPHVFVMWCVWVSWYVCMSGRLFWFALCTYLYILVCVTYIHTRIQTHTLTYTHTYINAYQNSLPYKVGVCGVCLYGRLFWYAFMYVCVYVGVCVCMRVCMYVGMSVCIYVYIYACLHVWTYACVCFYFFVCAKNVRHRRQMVLMFDA